MTRKLFIRTIALFIAATGCLGASAQTEVNVETAGTLSTLVPTCGARLKITGPINGTDAKFLRDQITNGKLTILDLADARIVSGGEAYYESLTTQNDVLGENMFIECSKLRNVTLPSSITTIGARAFSKTGLQKIDIPNSVYWLGMDAFSHCSSLSSVVIGRRVSRIDQGAFYDSAVKNVYAKPETPPAAPAYFFSSNPTIRVYTESISDYRASNWTSFGSIMPSLERYYPLEDEDPSVAVNKLAPTFFEDQACTTLKADYQAMTDEALTAALTEAGMPAFMIPITLKQKNAQWADYEKEFRIHSYRPYSDASYWANLLKSTGGCYMGNPTGIFTSNYTDSLYVFVDSDIPTDATLYIAGCTGNQLIYSATTGSKLKKGLNIILGQPDALYYILYTADTKSMTKPLSEWPEMKIHIEGGTVNGYYDISRHTNADYLAILKKATHERFTVKGRESLFNFKTSSYRTVFPNTIEKSICWFDSVAVWEKELMGFCTRVARGERDFAPYNLSGGDAIFPTYYNNPNFAIEGVSTDPGWANSSTYRTSYNSVECISRSLAVQLYDHDDWCCGHECGHNNQGAINMEGGTEVSNNLFSNMVRFLTGRVYTEGSSLSVVMDDRCKGLPFFSHTGNTQTRMYYQLYLYYHQARHDTSFYPRLFKALREDPMVLWQNTDKSLLKFVRKVCEVAQEDLTDFFTAWGFFEPCSLPNYDYTTNTVVVRQADIDRTKAEIAKYPKKNRNIIFIEDRVKHIPTWGAFIQPGQQRRNAEYVGQNGDLGQYSDYLPENAQPSDYVYYRADSLIAMKGSGGVGFLALDADGNFVHASNNYLFSIPSRFGTDYTLYSVDADGSLHEVPFGGDLDVTVHLDRVGTLSDSLTEMALKANISGSMNGTDIKYLRQLLTDNDLQAIDLTDARMLSGGQPYYLNYRSTANAIGDYAFYQCSQLSGIKLPESITAIGLNAFNGTGLHEVRIPSKVTNIGFGAFSNCPSLNNVYIGPKVKTIEERAFYNTYVTDAYVYALTPPAINYLAFTTKPVIHVYARALAAYQKTDWVNYGTLVGDLDDYPVGISEATATSGRPATDVIYDLQGRRMSRNAILPKGVYIVNGHKVAIK